MERTDSELLANIDAHLSSLCDKNATEHLFMIERMKSLEEKTTILSNEINDVKINEETRHGTTGVKIEKIKGEVKLLSVKTAGIVSAIAGLIMIYLNAHPELL